MPPPFNAHSFATMKTRLLGVVEGATRECVCGQLQLNFGPRYSERTQKATGLQTSRSVLMARGPITAFQPSVGFDGSWSNHGFSAKYGFCSAISFEDKTVIDWDTSLNCAMFVRNWNENVLVVFVSQITNLAVPFQNFVGMFETNLKPFLTTR